MEESRKNRAPARTPGRGAWKPLVYQSGYRSFHELQALLELFPFELHTSKERLVEDARFSVGNFGREFMVSLREG